MLLAALLACGDGDKKGHLPDAGLALAQLIVSPPDVSVTIVDDAVVTQPYTAHIIDAQGLDIDVTAEASFTLSDGTYGSFDGATLSVTGQGAGPVRVQATARGQTGDTGLVVMVKKAIIDPAGPPDAPTMFGNATEDPTRAPTIAYPLDQILVPPNLGQFDVHWNNNTGAGATDDLFEITMSNAYIDVRLYTKGLDMTNPQPFWTVYPPDVWYPIASSRQQLTLTVAGLDSTAPTTKGTAAAQHVDVTNENAQGGIYYWSTSGAAGIWRYDVGKPDVPPAAYFADDARPSGCMGCHALSRDGTKMAMTLDGGGGRGAVFNVADRTPVLPFDGVTQPAIYFDFATFDSQATKLVTVENGQLMLRQLDGTMISGPLPSVTDGLTQTHPEMSPDDSHLVNVEYNGGIDLEAYSGSIVIRTFDTTSNTFGAPTTLVPYVAGVANWYPSFSPDGQWIVFTRTTGYSYNDASAETWLVKADGTQDPVQLNIANLAPTVDGTGSGSDTGSGSGSMGSGSAIGSGIGSAAVGSASAGLANITNSWARWVPFGQTFGADNQPLFYLTFSSQRPFGVRIPYGGQPQIWMTPVFPTRAAAGQDPSGNAFRVPFQDVTTSNHIAQWTKAVVVQ